MGDTLHFIGGLGDKSGKSDDNGGGGGVVLGAGTASDPPTQAQMLKYMTSTGGPLVHEDQTCAFGYEDALYPGEDRLTCDNAVFTADMVGLYLHIEHRWREPNGESNWEDWVRITVYVSTTEIIIEQSIFALQSEAKERIEIWIGGALATLSKAVDEWTGLSGDEIIIVPDATTTEQRTIWINADTTLTATLDWACTGDYSHNNKVRLIGYDTTPGDMSEGGEFYGGAWHAEWGTPGCKWGDIDGQGTLAADLIDLTNGVEGLEFHNLFFHGTNKGAINTLFVMDASSLCMAWVNCKFDEGWTSIWFDGNYHSLIDCWWSSDWTSAALYTIGINVVVINCVINAGDSCVFGGPQTYANTIFIGGSYGIYTNEAGLCTVKDCTFYNQTIGCITLNHSSSVLVEVNNIFNPAAAADFAVNLAAANDGTVLYSDHSNAYSVAGVKLTNPWYDSGNSKSFKGPNSLEVDPEFEDADESLFNVENADIWTMGIVIGGIPTLPGAVPYPEL